MPVFVVAFQNKADQSIFEVHVTADSVAEALRLAREKFPIPGYSPIFATPRRGGDTRRATEAADGRARPKQGQGHQRDEAGVDE
ncbi:hypothetical protein ACFFWD_20795 [Bradyrhizobium erythrophlei]|uniref:hypothetical protein n=1 Tax=Bradyrhizobium erythrophlei TaxID=1437360 RepID=UPI0035E8874E